MRLGVISDIHLAPAGTPSAHWHNKLRFDLAETLLHSAVTWLVEQDIDRLVIAGDLTNAADTASFRRVLDIVKAAGIPVSAVPGNHDLTMQESTPREFEAFVSEAGVDAAPTTIVGSGDSTLSLFGLERSENLYQSIVPGELGGVIVTHFPVLPMADRLAPTGFRHAGDVENRSEIEQIVRQPGCPVVVIHGHLHVHDAFTSETILHLSTAALIEPPHHAAVVEIDASGPQKLRVRRLSAQMLASEPSSVPVLAALDGDWRYETDSWKSSSG